MSKIKQSYSKCSVKGCKNNTKNSQCSFFYYPKDIERAKQWAIACLREDLASKAHLLYNSYRVCGDHFEKIMFKNDLKNRLHPHAFPTLKITNNENDQNVPVSMLYR
ncbi:hypothetical protein P5V15_013366 [Pogonomyrmex californicus]